ncbi:class I SAM-dependent methyltransferase [Glaciihabitans sp. dw_435]|uniref:Eco57I restriction-modification methylase domain-containing protein n=1 Tax=Glaciihabitans sp. dw_435 TaxID=2720081 RepID=UPI001BD61F14|nr:class I SAM-dependent methyltransferase [Glaciihabitans sp. dw_435]
MADFASKASASAEKIRGGYYTPTELAAFVASWVAQAGFIRLEPSCGDGAILAPLSADSRAVVTGIELVASEAQAAREFARANVIESDFFEWFTPEKHSTFDGVAGNPPYIRFGNWPEKYRLGAMRFIEAQGMKASRLTNAFVPFVIASLLAVRQGGRVGLVVPAEILQVGYASELRRFLVDNSSTITIVSFRKLVFEGILQEVVLLLVERGDGPANIRTFEVSDGSELGTLVLDLDDRGSVRAPLHDNEKWTKYFLDPSAIEVLRKLRADSRLIPLGEIATVQVGVVSGRNSFFCMTAAEARDRGVIEWTVPLVSKSQQVPGLSYSQDDHSSFEETDRNTRLLHVQSDVQIGDHPALEKYIQDGENAGVNLGYKCSIRSPWWKLPTPWVPEAFMLRQVGTHPRIMANYTQATSTDTVHRVKLHDQSIDPAKLSVAAFNSATFALCEVIGRSYGGGILELEPSEARELPVIDPSVIPDGLAKAVDRLVRDGDVAGGLDLVDKVVLVGILGFSEREVLLLRSQWVRLRDRRMFRGKR